jgi:hypothetical protein
MSDHSTETGSKLRVDWLGAMAGALAAVSSAVLLSTLGAAGTIIGAAIGSVVATVGGALYRQGLATSRRTLAKAQAAARDKVGIAQAEVRRAGRTDDTTAQESHLEHADERLGQAHAKLDALASEVTPVPWKEQLRLLPWKRIALVAAGLFVVAILIITAFELMAGRTVSSFTGGSDNGGTTITDVGRRHSDRGNDQQRQPGDQDDSPSPNESTGPSEQPSDQPTGQPSDQVTDQPTDQPTESSEPSESASPEETTAPTSSPTALERTNEATP